MRDLSGGSAPFIVLVCSWSRAIHKERYRVLFVEVGEGFAGYGGGETKKLIFLRRRTMG